MAGPSASRTTKVMLIADAPWEMTSMLAGWTAPKTRAASPGVARMPMPDHGDDGAPLLDPDLAQLAQVAHQRIEPRRVLDGERDAHLAAREHVHHHFVALEDLEHRAEEAVGAEHPRRAHVDHRDARLPADRADRRVAQPLELGATARWWCRGRSGRLELSTTMGMPARTSGSAVAGWSTLAPKVASSAASS